MLMFWFAVILEGRALAYHNRIAATRRGTELPRVAPAAMLRHANVRLAAWFAGSRLMFWFAVILGERTLTGHYRVVITHRGTELPRVAPEPLCCDTQKLRLAASFCLI
jgi:hypothetical protein